MSRRAFLAQSSWAITQVSTGAMTAERALHAAVRRLEREGVDTITYRNARTGAQTVRNKVDVAVRRHVRTQIAQDGMRLTEQRLDEAGVELVEVSSHAGSRPSHQEWEGRVYSRNGDKVVDGVRYRDFRSACRWGDVADGIGGANCRHSYAAYFPGMRRAYRPNPGHPSGVPNSEAYELAQRQRAMERGIRAAKRELRGAQMLYAADPKPENLAGVANAKARLRKRQAAIRKLVAENPKVLQRSPRREWAGDMPKSATMSVMKHEEPLVRMSKERSALSISPTVNTKEYHDAFEAMPVPKAVSESIYNQAGKILGKADGTQKEYLCAVDARTGKLLADNLEMSANDGRTGFTAEQGARIRSCSNGAIMIHNHPSGTRPSITDVITAASESSIKGSVIVGHDGSVWFVSVDNPSIADLARGLYNQARQELGGRGAIVALDRLLKENGKHELFTWRRVR